MTAPVLTGVSDAINRGCRVVTALLLTGIVGSNAAEIVLRSAFNYSLTWIFEVNLLLATWLYFIGMCQVYHHGGDIAVDVLARRLPPALRRVWALVIDVIGVCTLLVIGWYGVRLLGVQWPIRTPGVGVPTGAYTVPVVLGALIMIVHILARRARPLPP